MIELVPLGAAQTVTGSKHLVCTSRARVLLDCGLFQGRRHETFARNRHIPGLVEFAESVRRGGPLRRVILVHGEPPAQEALAQALGARGFPAVEAPEAGARLRLW
jgi:Cft2 family RNA processing exonuclease